ncbi:MAG: hypothetical protein AAFN30_12280, partial [Actinomycetota bacterium]
MESLTKRLDRPDARITLAERAGVAPSVAVAAIEPAGRAVLDALARGAGASDGAGPVSDLVAAVGPVEPTRLVDRLGSASSLGSDLVDALFGDDLEAVAVDIGGKESNDPELGSTLLAQLAPVVVGLVAERQAADELDAEGLAAFLAEESSGHAGDDDESKANPGAPTSATLAAAAAAIGSPTAEIPVTPADGGAAAPPPGPASDADDDGAADDDDAADGDGAAGDEATDPDGADAADGDGAAGDEATDPDGADAEDADPSGDGDASGEESKSAPGAERAEGADTADTADTAGTED